MPRDLFKAATTPDAVTRAFSRYTVLGSAALHLGIVAVVLIAPLVAEDVLPKPDVASVRFVNASFVPPNPPAPAPPVVRVSNVNRNAAPIVAPSRIREEEPAPPANVATGGFELGNSHAATGFGSDIGDTLANAPPAPPPTATPARPQRPVPIGGQIHAPIKTRDVAPIYPQIAQAARVEGDVVIQAIIGTDGVVQEARVVSGSPLLNDAALSAVKQWRYTPTLLNNQPVAVIMTVTVAFRLQH